MRVGVFHKISVRISAQQYVYWDKDVKKKINDKKSGKSLQLGNFFPHSQFLFIHFILFIQLKYHK